MGIRFYCPNGHKLNVKSFLAGKRGICPRCSARFRIPDESQIPKGAPKTRPEAEGPRGDAPLAAESTAAVEVSSPVTQAQDPFPEPVTPESESTEIPDPIAESPDANWFVRPPTGGQYGPATGEVLRRWIAEGRVSSDTHVWREGWSDWCAAGRLFPELADDDVVEPPASDVSLEVEIEMQEEDDDGLSLRNSSLPRRQTATSRSKSIAIIVTLALVSLVLLFLLVWVLDGMK